MPTLLDEATRALGWRWSEPWSSWLCPVSHLISDMQVGNMAVSGTIACPLCRAEANDPATRNARQAEQQRQRGQVERAAERIAAFPMPVWTEAIRDDPFGDRRRTRVRKPEPEPVLVAKGRRYDLEDD